MNGLKLNMAQQIIKIMLMIAVVTYHVNPDAMISVTFMVRRGSVIVSVLLWRDDF